MTSGLRQLPPQQLDYLLAKGLAVVDVEYRLVRFPSRDSLWSRGAAEEEQED